MASRFNSGSSRGVLTFVNLLCVVACAWILTVDLLTRIPMGGVSLSGLATLGTATLAVAMTPMLIRSWQRWIHGPNWPRNEAAPARVPLGLLLFLVLVVIRLPIGTTAEGLQNVCVYGSFVLIIVLVAELMHPRDLVWFDKVFPVLAGLASLVYLCTVLAGDSELIYSERPFALAAMIFMAVTVPQRGRGIHFVLPFLVAAATVLSLSRTATLIVMLDLVFIVVRFPKGRRRGKVLWMFVAMVLAVVTLWFTYPPFKDRFVSGDNAVSVGGTAVNTSGRTEIWAFVWHDAMRSPLVGQGPGSAVELIMRWRVGINQPHNEFLRIFHDFGVIGVVVWTLGFASLMVLVIRRARRYDRPVDWGAVIALTSLLLASLTDNPIVYPFVMIPAAVVVGLCLGREATVDTRTVPRRALSALLMAGGRRVRALRGLQRPRESRVSRHDADPA